MSESSMRLGNIRPAAGATKDTKRRGKGAATGLGGTAGKGHKGKKARSGGKIPVWFEGGQMPIQRRLPKRGFINPTRVEYHVVQVGRLAGAPAGTTIDAAWLRSAKLVRRKGSLLDFFRKSPLVGEQLDLTRSRDRGRRVAI